MAFTIERRAPNQLFIGNEWVSAGGGGSFATYHPATGEKIADLAAGEAGDIDKAVKAARAAFNDPKWRNMDAADRGLLLWRIADAIEARQADLVRIEVVDNGKPLREAQIDLRAAIRATLRLSSPAWLAQPSTTSSMT